MARQVLRVEPAARTRLFGRVPRDQAGALQPEERFFGERLAVGRSAVPTDQGAHRLAERRIGSERGQDTPQRVVVKTDATTEVRLKPSDIKSRRRSHLSLMPEDLMNYMTEQQLVDVVKYLSTLKEDRRAAR